MAARRPVKPKAPPESYWHRRNTAGFVLFLFIWDLRSSAKSGFQFFCAHFGCRIILLWCFTTIWQRSASHFCEHSGPFKTFLMQVLRISSLEMVGLRCAAKKYLSTRETAVQVEREREKKKPLLIVRRRFSSKQGKHRIICGHHCLVETWSFMDQLFPFWFNSPCDWFSVR